MYTNPDILLSLDGMLVSQARLPSGVEVDATIDLPDPPKQLRMCRMPHTMWLTHPLFTLSVPYSRPVFTLFVRKALYGGGGLDDRGVQHHHEGAAPHTSKESLHLQPQRYGQGFPR